MISREFAVKDMKVQFKADDTGELNLVRTDLASHKFEKKALQLSPEKFSNVLFRSMLIFQVQFQAIKYKIYLNIRDIDTFEKCHFFFPHNLQKSDAINV